MMSDVRYTIELLDDHGGFVHVVFTEMQPPAQFLPGHGHGSMVYGAEVEARGSGLAPYASRWWISLLAGQLWKRRIGPKDPEERNTWYMRGIIRSYRRRFSSLLAQRLQDVVLGPEDVKAFREIDGEMPLDRIETEIEDFLLVATDHLPRFERLDADDLTATPDDLSSFRREWDIYEPLLRERRDDSRMQALYGRLDEYYRELGSIKRFRLKKAKALEVSLRRLVVLGNLALRALDEARRDGKPLRMVSTSEARSEPWPRDRAVHLRQLVIENLRCIEELDLSLALPGQRNRGQWLVFLGKNGMGKTSLLRAIALALLPASVANEYVRNLSRDAPLIRHGTERGHISLALGDSDLTAAKIVHGEPGEAIEAYRPPSPRPLVLGYGCRRGSAFGGPAREARADPWDGCATLFVENSHLVHTDTWLRDLRDLVLTRNEDQGFFDGVCSMLKRVLAIRELTIEPEATWIDIGEIGRVRLGGLSDGYLTTLGWVADMVARWAKYARDAGYTLDASFAQQMPAVVLIDEIDMHLHPEWQTRVIASLRESFPMTTFIATTHNPQTLRGFEAEEIVRLELDEDGRVFPLRPNTSPKLKTGSELYETFFGIDGYMPPELDEALLDYARLASDPGRSNEDEATMQALRARLENAGIRTIEPIEREANA